MSSRKTIIVSLKPLSTKEVKSLSKTFQLVEFDKSIHLGKKIYELGDFETLYINSDISWFNLNFKNQSSSSIEWFKEQEKRGYRVIYFYSSKSHINLVDTKHKIKHFFKFDNKAEFEKLVKSNAVNLEDVKSATIECQPVEEEVRDIVECDFKILNDAIDDVKKAKDVLRKQKKTLENHFTDTVRLAKKLKKENQKLRDEIKSLKGEKISFFTTLKKKFSASIATSAKIEIDRIEKKFTVTWTVNSQEKTKCFSWANGENKSDVKDAAIKFLKSLSQEE